MTCSSRSAPRRGSWPWAGPRPSTCRFGFYVVAWAGLRSLGPHRDVDLGERRRPDLGAEPPLRAGGRVRSRPPPCSSCSPPRSSRPGSASWPGRGQAARSASPEASLATRATPAQLSRAGNPAGPTRVGGYLGFANSLDTALRGALGQHARDAGAGGAPLLLGGGDLRHLGRPELGGIDSEHARRAHATGSPFVLPTSVGSTPVGADRPADVLRRRLARPNLVFHAESATRAVVPDLEGLRTPATAPSSRPSGWGAVHLHRRIRGERPHRRRSSAATEPGSRCRPPRNSSTCSCRTPTRGSGPGQVDHRAGDTTTYDKVESLIAWIGPHTRYSTDIPPLPAGADTVDEFLFGNRVGFCEQISTSLAVMLRSLGIPAREAVGYVPGPLQPDHRPLRRSGPTTPTPGSRCGFRDTGGRASTPPPWCRSPTRARAPRPCRTSRRRSAVSRWVPVAAVLFGAGLVASCCAGGAPARRLGRNGWRAASSAPAGGPAVPAGPARPSASTPRPSTACPAAVRSPGAGWPPRSKRASTGERSRPRRPGARCRNRHGAPGSVGVWVRARGADGEGGGLHRGQARTCNVQLYEPLRSAR